MEVEDAGELGPFRDGQLWVLRERCDSCIFRPGNLMMLNGGTVKSMVDACLAEPSGAGNIPCHHTVIGERAICRGFWDGYRDRIGLLQAAERMGLVTEVGLDELAGSW